MAEREGEIAGRRERFFVNGLWIGAAVLVVSGFILRFLASLLAVSDLRIIGVAVIAVGLAVAVLGWVGERFLAGRHAG